MTAGRHVDGADLPVPQQRIHNAPLAPESLAGPEGQFVDHVERESMPQVLIGSSLLTSVHTSRVLRRTAPAIAARPGDVVQGFGVPVAGEKIQAVRETLL